MQHTSTDVGLALLLAGGLVNGGRLPPMQLKQASQLAIRAVTWIRKKGVVEGGLVLCGGSSQIFEAATQRSRVRWFPSEGGSAQSIKPLLRYVLSPEEQKVIARPPWRLRQLTCACQGVARMGS